MDVSFPVWSLESCLFMLWSLDLCILFSWMFCVSSDPQCLLTNGKLPLWAKRLVSLPGERDA